MNNRPTASVSFDERVLESLDAYCFSLRLSRSLIINAAVTHFLVSSSEEERASMIERYARVRESETAPLSDAAMTSETP